MPENILNTRIKLKYDTVENWARSTMELLPGEIAIEYNQLNSALKIKVGINDLKYFNKTTQEEATYDDYFESPEEYTSRYLYFNELPYLQANAADVSAWAKKNQGDAADIYYSAENSITAVNTLLTQLIGNDRYYQIEQGTGANVGKIRLASRNPNIANSDFTSDETYISVGSTVAIADDSLNLTVANNTSTLSVNIADTSDTTLGISNNNLLTLATANNIAKKGLYVPKTSVNNHSIVADQGKVAVLTGITTNDGHTLQETATQVYTADKINELINPAMEFKGVVTATPQNNEGGIINLTNVSKGDSYKISSQGTLLDGENGNEITLKPNDLIIALKDNPNPYINTIDWAIIPAGTDSNDTNRAISYINPSHDAQNPATATQLLNNTPGTLTIAGGNGINITGSNNTLTIDVDTTHMDSVDVSKLTQNDTYLIFDCGTAYNWTVVDDEPD